MGCGPVVLVGSGGATVGGGGNVAVGCKPDNVGVGAIADEAGVGCSPAAVGATVPLTGVGMTSTGGSSPPQAARAKMSRERTIAGAIAPMRRPWKKWLIRFIMFFEGPVAPLGKVRMEACTTGGTLSYG